METMAILLTFSFIFIVSRPLKGARAIKENNGKIQDRNRADRKRS
jgi:hypothetical protein